MLSNWRMNLFCIALAVATLAMGNCRRGESLSVEPVLEAEVDRVAESLEALEKANIPAGLVPLLKTHQASLAEARKATSPDLRLYRLRDAWIGADAISFFVANAPAQSDLGALERLWEARRNAFEAETSFDQPSALHRALAQAAHNRGQKFFRASLPYGRTSAPGEGLYYLAEAEGNRRFRDFVLALPDDDDQERSAHSVALRDEFARLENELLDFFESDRVSGASIPVSARLKEARELLDAKFIDGATLALLETRRELSRKKKEPGAAPDAAIIPVAGNSIRACFAAMSREKNADATINAQLLPLFDSLHAQPEKPLAVNKGSVTVTLVRWPYT